VPHHDKIVQQVSVFLENKSGRLAEVCTALGDSGINISALSIADTSDFGILRLIVSDPDKAAQLLSETGLSVSETAVVALQVADRPGGLAGVLQLLQREEINVEYLYAFVGTRRGDAIVVLRVSDEAMAKTIGLLEANGVPILTADKVYAP
jgi:hypothetical protein